MGIFIGLFLVILLILYSVFRKQIRQKDKRINDLIGSLSSLENKLKGLERRTAFRLILTKELPCVFEIIEVGDRVLGALKHKKGEGKIKDISRTGLKLLCDIDFPVRKKITIQINFNLQGENFSLCGVFVRKKEEINGQINYGIQFVKNEMREQQRLASLIQKIEISRQGKRA